VTQFKDVFSTTAKVILALVIISALVGVGFLVLGGLGGTLMPASSTSSTRAATAEEDAADALRATMPKSMWDRGIARAVKHHCFVSGMNQEEVVRALGEPTQKTDLGDYGSDWTWQLPPGKCLKYDGDKCVEQEKNEPRIAFTRKGSLHYATDGCETLSGHFVYLSRDELFK
jgi:hypothetical protein